MLRIYVQYSNDEEFGNSVTRSMSIENTHILVSDLKEMIRKKLLIDPSSQKLLTKIFDGSLTEMSDSSPISVFSLKQNSTIYLKIITYNYETETERKADLNKIKLKYFKYLKLLNNASRIVCLNVKIEAKEESSNSFDYTFSLSKSELNEILIEKTKKGNIDEIKSFYNSYSNLRIELGRKGKNALHYACLSKDPDILKQILLFEVDVNQKTTDMWSPLHLACFKGKGEGTIKIN